MMGTSAMTSPGFRIVPQPPRPSDELLAQFKPIITSHLSDNMGRHYGAVGLKRYNRTGKLVGAALTVKTRPGDNLMVHKALDLAQKGDVLVVDGGGDVDNALVGELMQLYAASRGVVGFVIDGAIRDVAAFDAFPCYARGNVHRGPYKDGPGEIGVTVSIGGMVVEPGDIIVGDEDGIVAIPQRDAQALLELARKKAAEEEAAKRQIAKGAWDRSWVDKALAAKGFMGTGQSSDGGPPT
jgi:regulator of RNase E activity RraA